MSIRRKICLAFAVLVTGGLLAGYGVSCETEVGDDNINAEDAANTISTQYKDRIGLVLTDITCESGTPEVGAKFSCDATNSADVSLDIEATVTKIDDSSNKAIFNWDVAKATAGPTTFTDTALKALHGLGRAIDSIECPGGTVIEKGNVIDCTGTMDDGSKRKVTITLTDGDGAINVKLLGPA